MISMQWIVTLESRDLNISEKFTIEAESGRKARWQGIKELLKKYPHLKEINIDFTFA